MKHATAVRGSAVIAGEVTMLRSKADVKFDTGDKEESGCLSANLARGLSRVLAPSDGNAEGALGSGWLATDRRERGRGLYNIHLCGLTAPTVKQVSGFASCQLSQPSPGPEAPFSPSLAAPTGHHADSGTLALAPQVVVRQEVGLPEPAPQQLLGPRGSGLTKGVLPPTLITDSTGTHLVLTMTNTNTDNPGLPSASPQQSLSPPGSPAPGRPAQMDLEPPLQPLFGPPVSLLKKEPDYEEAVSQQPKPQENGYSSQQMDDLFDILIQSGEIPADFKDPAALLPEEKPTVPTPPCTELPSAVYPLSGSPALPGRLEDFLESSTGLLLLTGGHEGPEPISLIDDLHSQMPSISAILDYPPSPMDTAELNFVPEPSGPVGLELTDGPLDGMDWLELSGGQVLSLAPLSTTAPSLFSTDFLDGHDLQLHWDSCL
ncbi:myocardin-related transcription factor A-like [Echinops telfairi]|uniref:Myocardin-related transcription factor A-like n=1 Tax=Echinops telfairi TaxID=9371 RepID=A0AC55CPV4_ECHTE|nr:myocardin-related transcription factor A-like [Echinops telfairi]